MNLSNIFGTHSVFYFYGVEHLAINMQTYITEGLKNNELICISMAPTLYDDMIKILPMPQMDQLDDHVMQRLIAAFQAGGCNGLREAVVQLTAETMKKGFSGIRCIWQPSVQMSALSSDEWRCWEESLTEAMEGTTCSILCLTDMMDIFANRMQIEDERIRQALQVHPYMLYKMHLEEVSSLRV